MNLKTKCPLCQSDSATIFLARPHTPVHQNLIISDQKTALDVIRGDLELAVCNHCGFVFNAAFDSALLKYNQDYDNAQFFSHVFDNYLTSLLNYLIHERDIRGCRVVEVGCGNGYFLRKLIEGGQNTGVGYDPSYRGPLEDLQGRLRFEQSYYGPQEAGTGADVVICRHVIEHVPDPLALLSSVRQALGSSPAAYVFFETPTVEWILNQRAFWDFFYEHCSLFSASSLTTAFQLAGLQVERILPEFGGQYLWLEAKLSSPEKPSDVTFEAGKIPPLAEEFALAEKRLINTWQNRVQMLNGTGRVAIWGAGAKGVTFANLVDAESRQIACVVDINPNKQGHYLPGTGHPIVDFREVPSHGVTTAIVMNPNYRQEISMLLENAGINLRLLDLTDGMEEQR